VLTYILETESAIADAAPGNNIEQSVTPIVFSGSAPAVWLSVQSPDPGRLKPGQDVTYTIRYDNLGSKAAHTTTVTVSLSSGLNPFNILPAPTRVLSDTNFAGGVFVWDLGDLAVGSSNVIQIQAHVGAVPPDGSLVLATIHSGDYDVHTLAGGAFDLRKATFPPRIFLPLVWR
jgi:uncharacterized repeat protein (TIGR01451 family)